MSFRDEIREQAVEDAMIEEDADHVVSIVRIDNISIDDAVVKLKIKEHRIEDVRYLVEQELQKAD